MGRVKDNSSISDLGEWIDFGTFHRDGKHWREAGEDIMSLLLEQFHLKYL